MKTLTAESWNTKIKQQVSDSHHGFLIPVLDLIAQEITVLLAFLLNTRIQKWRQPHILSVTLVGTEKTFHSICEALFPKIYGWYYTEIPNWKKNGYRNKWAEPMYIAITQWKVQQWHWVCEVPGCSKWGYAQMQQSWAQKQRKRICLPLKGLR